MKLLKTFSLVLLTALFAWGCNQKKAGDQKKKTKKAPSFTKVVAVVHPTADNEASGTVTFTKVEKGVRVQGNFTGLSQGKHGFHIHEYGDCRADDGTSAGGHYNPTDKKHGSPTQDARHMGDMGNLVVGEDGKATIDYVDPKIKLNGPTSIIGRGIVIHGGADDFESQPSGAAGPRMACGVIGVANPEIDSTQN